MEISYILRVFFSVITYIFLATKALCPIRLSMPKWNAIVVEKLKYLNYRYCFLKIRKEKYFVLTWSLIPLVRLSFYTQNFNLHVTAVCKPGWCATLFLSLASNCGIMLKSVQVTTLHVVSNWDVVAIFISPWMTSVHEDLDITWAKLSLGLYRSELTSWLLL